MKLSIPLTGMVRADAMRVGGKHAFRSVRVRHLDAKGVSVPCGLATEQARITFTQDGGALADVIQATRAAGYEAVHLPLNLLISMMI